MLTDLVKEVNQSFWGFFYSGDRKISLPITVSVQPNRGEAIWNLETGKLVTTEITQSIKTNTLKVGKSMISFIVPNIRFNNANLAGEGRILNIEIELPNGKVKFEAIGEHYERIGKRTSLANYLIDAKITYINPIEEEVFKDYLLRGEKIVAAQRENFLFGVTER